MIQPTLHHFKKLPSHLRAGFSQHLLSPRAVLDELGIHEGDTIFEVGNPVGFFAAAGLSLVGQPGRFIVAGPNEESFDRVSHLEMYGQLSQVLLADVLMNRAFEHGTADWIILTNVLSSSMHPDQFCIAVGDYLKPGGHVVLLDWHIEQAAGPEAERRVGREQAVRTLTQCGMTFEKALHTPGYHYGLVFRTTSTVR